MEHDVDDNGNEIHVDVDEQIPTGICKICKDKAEEESQPAESNE